MFLSSQIIKCPLSTITPIKLTILISPNSLYLNPINSQTLTSKLSHKQNLPHQISILTQEVTLNYLHSPLFPSLPNPTFTKFKPLELPKTFILIFHTINSARFKFKSIHNPMKLPSKVLNSSKLKQYHKKISTVTIPLHKKHLEGTIFRMVQFMKGSSIPITNFKVVLYKF